MITMEPVLKRGYTSWDRDVLPRDEYEARVDTVRTALRAEGCEALVLVNYSLLGALFDYADLAYLAGAQAGGALLVTLHEPPVLVSFGGGRELPFLRAQTWIADVLPGAGRPFEVIAGQLRTLGHGGGRLATVGAQQLPHAASERFHRALADFSLHAFDRRLAALRAVKRPRELTAMRIAKGIADDALAAGLAEFTDGADNTAALIEAERIARFHKSRDVRVLASMNGPELRPFEGRLGERHAPLRLWVAAQYQGYWACAAGQSPTAQANAAERAVRAMQAAVRAGATAGDVANAGIAALPGALADAALDYGLGGTIGLALTEGVAIHPTSRDVLLAGSVLALQAVVPDEATPAIAAALVRVDETHATPLESLHVE